MGGRTTRFDPDAARGILARALATPLPGPSAQAAMAPEYLSCIDTSEAPSGCRRASVLVLIHPVGGALRFPLIERPESDGAHGGQVSLPGGAREAGEGAAETALREIEEELGVPATAIEILGPLSELFVPSSRFLVSPFVGWSSRLPGFRPSPSEVAGLFEPSLAELLCPCSRRSETRVLGSRGWAIPFYSLGGRKVWGATARILSELEAALAASPEALGDLGESAW